MPRILCLVLKQHSHNPSSLKTVHRTVLSTLTFSPDLAVNLDKKENRVVKRLLCCGSPNWARTSDIMINSQDVYFKKVSIYRNFRTFRMLSVVNL